MNRRERRRAKGSAQIRSTPGGEVVVSDTPGMGNPHDLSGHLTELAQRVIRRAREQDPELLGLEMVVIVTDRQRKAQGLGTQQHAGQLDELLGRTLAVLTEAVARIVQVQPELGALVQQWMLRYRAH